MRQSSKNEGIKIAQAAKDLNVTSVTIRRYLSEFNIETMTDNNGVKVLPGSAMDELKEIRRLKEDGLTNPKVMEFLDGMRTNAPSGDAKESKSKASEATEKTSTRAKAAVKPEVKKRVTRKRTKEVDDAEGDVEQEEVEEIKEAPETEEQVDSTEAAQTEDGEGPGGNKAKHSLTCQTCSKVFEHMNPRLRDCLDCYRLKRKERRRGGEKHKNVIQHPLAQQMASKSASKPAPESLPGSGDSSGAGDRYTPPAAPSRPSMPFSAPAANFAPVASATAQTAVSPALNPVKRSYISKNYRKAIEETRNITANLKRRLERPDLPEGERRWLEQIYAYQLILHQGWRHLAEYKQGGQPLGPGDN